VESGSVAAAGYSFRSMTAEDLYMVHRWLETPEVRRWWGDPDREISLLQADLHDPRMAMWIVSHQAFRFAYIQDYAPGDWLMHHFGFLPPGSRGIDQFIGEPDMIGCGHGSAFVRAHVDRLFAAGVLAVGVDPDPENARAIRAYEKAGFVPGQVQNTEWGPALLMTRFAERKLRAHSLPG